MEKIIDELVRIMTEEIKAFNKLLATLKAKQKAIVEGEIEKLKVQVKNEEKIIKETASLEKIRQEQTQILAEQLMMKTGNPKLNEIIEKVEEKYAQRLTEQRDLLKTLLEKIQHLNASNQFLINYSLKFIEDNLRLLSNAQNQTTFYAKNGERQNTLNKQIILDKEI